MNDSNGKKNEFDAELRLILAETRLAGPKPSRELFERVLEDARRVRKEGRFREDTSFIRSITDWFGNRSGATAIAGPRLVAGTFLTSIVTCCFLGYAAVAVLPESSITFFGVNASLEYEFLAVPSVADILPED